MAKFPLILTLDDDLQNPPQEVEKMVRHLPRSRPRLRLSDEGNPLKGQRFHFLSRKIMSKLLGPDIFPKSSAFRLFRSDLPGGRQD